MWLSPVYKSPQDDNGYDISDYQDIDPAVRHLGGYGRAACRSAQARSEDRDGFGGQPHVRRACLVPGSRDKDDPHADWYWWRPARPGHEPGTPGAEPNRWGSYFGGSAWQYDPKRGEYYLHQFSRKQPDLNWENPEVRKAVYRMMNWWMDVAIDGSAWT